VPSTLPVLSLLSDFDRSDFFFVLASGQLTHVVTRDCIDHEPVKLAVFAIVMELEVTMLDLLRVPPTPEAIEEKLQTLSTGRREKAQLRAQDKYNEVTPLGVLLATNFIDRSELVIEDNMEQLPFPSKNEARSFFSRAMRVRNQIAHGLDISSELASPGQVVAFVQEVEKVVTGLERVLGKLPPKPPL
jgi:hypothetical protein